MKHHRTPLIIISLTLGLTSLMCSMFTPAGPVEVSEAEKQATVSRLQMTVEALETQVVTPTPLPTSPIVLPTIVKQPAGSISGQLTYPAEEIPPLRIVAVKLDSGEFFATDVVKDGEYILYGLPEGTYHVMAYLQDFKNIDPGQAGGYTQFVLCGLSTACSDHSLIDVKVIANQNTPDINPGDWYAPSGSFPKDPTR